jgi:hypothetical protein
MDEGQFWIISIIAPAVLLIVLVWLVVRARSTRDGAERRRAEEGTRDLYADEERRRREGTDDL